MKFELILLAAVATFVSASSPYADVPKDFYKTQVFSDFFKEDLTDDEFEDLSPLFKALQVPYEKIILEYEHFSDEELDISFLDDIMREVEAAFDLEEGEIDPEYELDLPSFDDILKSFNDTDPMLADVKLEIEDTFLDARDTMDDMTLKTDQAIRLLRLKLTKRRTAYCMYSHIPDYAKAVIDGKNEAVDCFKEAKFSTVALVKEVKKSIGEVKQCTVRTKKIVTRCMRRKTILGKVFYCLTNINNVANEIREAGSNVQNAVTITTDNVPAILARFQQCEVSSIRSMILNLGVVFGTMVKCIVYPLIP